MSIKIYRFINSRFTSNTFVLSKEGSEAVWLVDPGDIQPILSWIQNNNKSTIRGVLLTHSHFDHIYGLNELLAAFPHCLIYVAKEYGKKSLYDAKKNGSRYTESSFVLQEEADVRLMDKTIELWSGVDIRILTTLGHSPDSVCLLHDNVLFTGDTLIPNVRTVTKLKGGSVADLKKTIEYLKCYQGEGITIYPGHEDIFPLDGYDLTIATFNPLMGNK